MRQKLIETAEITPPKVYRELSEIKEPLATLKDVRNKYPDKTPSEVKLWLDEGHGLKVVEENEKQKEE